MFSNPAPSNPAPPEVNRDVSMGGDGTTGLSQGLEEFMHGGFDAAAKRIEAMGRSNSTGKEEAKDLPASTAGSADVEEEKKKKKKKKAAETAPNATKPNRPTRSASADANSDARPSVGPQSAKELTDEDREERGHDEELMDFEDDDNPAPKPASAKKPAPTLPLPPQSASTLGSGPPQVDLQPSSQGKDWESDSDDDDDDEDEEGVSGDEDEASYELEMSKLVKMGNEQLTQKIITLNLQLDDMESKMRLEPKHMLTKAKLDAFAVIDRTVPENGYVENDNGREPQYSEAQKQEMERAKQNTMTMLKSINGSVSKILDWNDDYMIEVMFNIMQHLHHQRTTFKVDYEDIKWKIKMCEEAQNRKVTLKAIEDKARRERRVQETLKRARGSEEGSGKSPGKRKQAYAESSLSVGAAQLVKKKRK